jgi:formate--tetrahydrofolate ligase
MPHDLAIARASRLRPNTEVAEQIGIPLDALDFHGKHIAKLERDYNLSLRDRDDGKLVPVTAINPTPAGEGKTTTIALGDAMPGLPAVPAVHGHRRQSGRRDRRLVLDVDRRGRESVRAA